MKAKLKLIIETWLLFPYLNILVLIRREINLEKCIEIFIN